MRNLNNFIIERLKLNKDTKISNNNFSEKNCIFIPFDDIYDELMNKYNKYRINQDQGFVIFIIPIEVVKNYKYSHGRAVYKIPDKYNDFDELKDDYIKGKLKIDNSIEKLEI